MKVRFLFMLAAMSLIAAVVVNAQTGFAGKWTGDRQGQSGVEPTTLELTVKGDDVTGSVTVGRSPRVQISDGQVKEGKLMFKQPALLNGQRIQISWLGELKDNELTLDRFFPSGNTLPTLVLKRSK